MPAVRFRLNGAEVAFDLADPHVTLLEFLRSRGLTGAKEGCAEGECGACAVVLLGEGPDGMARYRAVNACLVLLPMVHGRQVLTVEALAGVDGRGASTLGAEPRAAAAACLHGPGPREGSSAGPQPISERDDQLHPVQQALVDHGGSQCGYCTPGFVMSLFAEYYRPGRRAPGDVDLEAIAGNLCRCTGYRPIRDAARSLPLPAQGDPFHAPLAAPPPPLPPFPEPEPAGEARQRDGSDGSAAPAPFLRPTSLADLLAVLRRHPDAKLVAGGTDVAVEANLLGRRWPVLVSVEAVPELRILAERAGALEIGAALTLTELEERLAGRLPLLDQLFPLFASRLVRNRATLGGNLATASPIGDAAPVLLALDAQVRAAGPDGERLIPLEAFFAGYRRTALRPGEVIVAVRVPLPLPAFARFYKVSKRQHDDISTVAAAFALDLDPAGRVARVRLAYGGVAPTPARARAAEEALLGRPWAPEAVAAARAVLAEEFSPIDDHRGSAAYRRALVQALLERFYAEWEEAVRAGVA